MISILSSSGSGDAGEVGTVNSEPVGEDPAVSWVMTKDVHQAWQIPHVPSRGTRVLCAISAAQHAQDNDPH